MNKFENIEIKLNTLTIKRFLASDDFYPLLQKKSTRIKTAIRRAGKKVTLENARGKDGRAQLRIIAHDMTPYDFKSALIQTALANAKLKPGTGPSKGVS